MIPELWPIFLSAPEVNIKALNRALLLLLDLQYNEVPTSDWVLVTSKDIPEGPGQLQATTPPLDKVPTNEFAGMSADGVNDFLWDNKERLENASIFWNIWVTIDAKGLETDTGLVTERDYDYDEATQNGSFVKSFRATRLPYEEVWGMYVNLDIANLGFEDFVNESAGIQDDGTWKWLEPFQYTLDVDERMRYERMENERKARVEKALEEMRQLGHID